jgi:hypothetical protein
MAAGAFRTALAASLNCPKMSDQEAVEQVTRVWEQFLSALSQNRAEGALELVSPELRPELAAAFRSPAADLPAFAKNVKGFDVVHILPCIVQAYVTRRTTEGERSYPMLFGLRPDGRWEIGTL